MEALQGSYLRAVAASAGCVLAGEPEIDEGVDLILTHRASQHVAINDRVARLEVQMKSTADSSKITSEHVEVSLSADRFNYFATSQPGVDKIVVAMAVPGNQAHWSYSRPKGLTVHYQAYWINLADEPPIQSGNKSIKIPKSQPLTDITLCDIMERIGQGGRP